MVVLPLLCIFFLLNFQGNAAAEIELPTISHQSKLQTYIVHVEQPKIRLAGESKNDIESWHMSFLQAVKRESSFEQPQLLYSYRNVMSGFSARLAKEQVKGMEEKDGFISAMPETIMSLHTTHTPDYLGLNQEFGLWKDSNFGKGVIIGVFDSGIHPGHPSFSDDEGIMSPPPAKWKGRCEFNTSVCNNKLIGARNFNRATNSLLMGESPSDENGHGTHTASTAGGAFVEDAKALGNAGGKAAGIAPLAHLAIYKVCSAKGCSSSDVLAGIDAAIDDGVDIRDFVSHR